MAATAVPRQYEIARTAARNKFATKIGLATELQIYTERMIANQRSSAFQRLYNDRKIAMRARTIINYVTIAQAIGILDDSLQPTGKVTASTKVDGFANHLKDCLLPYVKDKGFSLEHIRDFIGTALSDKRPIHPITPQLLYSKLTPDISEFAFTQCIYMLAELFSDRLRVRTLRTLLHREVYWGSL